MQKFNKGDVVVLKSGGPLMTVQNCGDYSFSSGIEHGVFCVWFDGPKKQEDAFDEASLQLYVEQDQL